GEAPIRRAERHGDPPLSFAQERLWLLDRLRPGGADYNLPAAVWWSGRLDEAALAASFAEVARRHEVLRTTFATAGDGRPVQVIAPRPAPATQVIDLGALAAAAREPCARRLAAAVASRPFDLERGPLGRLLVVRLGEERQLAVLVLHHIVADGWSMGVLIRELAAIYGAVTGGSPRPLPELPIQYADFAIWQRAWLNGEVLAGQLDYWRQRLDGAPAVVELPRDAPPKAVRTRRAARCARRLPAALSVSLGELSRRSGATLFMTLLAAWNALLMRQTGQLDLVIGTPIANRHRLETEGLIGFFVNTLALRTDLSGNPRFRELLARVRDGALGAYAHQDLPLQKLVEELRPERGAETTPLFQVMFLHTRQEAAAPALPGVELRSLELAGEVARFELSLGVEQGDAGLLALLEYDAERFRSDTILRLLDHFAALLSGVAGDGELRLGELPLLSAGERHHLVREWNDTVRHEDEGEACLHQLFEAQAARRPEAVALCLDGAGLSYGELDRRALALADRLAGWGVGPGVRVGVAGERSFGMIVALLAVLKAGGAYLPLDPAVPRARLLLLLADSRAPLVLAGPALRRELGGEVSEQVRVVALEEEAEGGEAVAAGPAAARSRGAAVPDGLAGVIYTSGSTGTPNGVLVGHRGAVNLVRQATRLFELGPSSR
ncbi:MAG: AMP-binding protein, partial [Acidobacteria bacterium]|nr:AMP-binding protein [Acidobacteriota bacterium]